MQIITWEGGFYLFRSKKQEARSKRQRRKIQEARYKIQEPLAFRRPTYSRQATQLILNVECRLKNEEVGIRGIFESRISTNKVSFLVSRFLLLISPMTLETSFLNSKFKIQRSAFDIFAYRISYFVPRISHFISRSTSSSVYLGAPPFCVAT